MWHLFLSLMKALACHCYTYPKPTCLEARVGGCPGGGHSAHPLCLCPSQWKGALQSPAIFWNCSPIYLHCGRKLKVTCPLHEKGNLLGLWMKKLYRLLPSYLGFKGRACFWHSKAHLQNEKAHNKVITELLDTEFKTHTATNNYSMKFTSHSSITSKSVKSCPRITCLSFIAIWHGSPITRHRAWFSPRAENHAELNVRLFSRFKVDVSKWILLGLWLPAS